MCVCCLSLEAGALAHSLRCSHPDEEDHSQTQSPESVSVPSLSSQCTSTRGLPFHDPLKYVMPIIGQLLVRPRHSLIPLPEAPGVSGESVAESGENPDLVTVSPLNHEPWGVRDHAVPINQHPQHLLTSMEWALGKH